MDPRDNLILGGLPDEERERVAKDMRVERLRLGDIVYEQDAVVQDVYFPLSGAVSVLMLFVIMLTLRRREDSVRPVEVSVAGAVMALVFGGLVFAALASYGDRVAEMPETAPDTAALGELLFSRWALPFEVASLVLLVALVAAVWWSREEKR